MDIWKLSSCDQCFDIVNTTVYKVKQDTLDMLQKIDDTIDCFNDFSYVTVDDVKVADSSVCTYCYNLYFDANKKYKDIKNRNGLCSDLIDAMNYTRLTWGEKYHCSLAVKDSGEIWGVTALVLILPVMLYLGAWFHTKYFLTRSAEGMQEPLLAPESSESHS